MLSREDRDRLKVLHEVRRGHITQAEAGKQLRLSERWVRKLLARIGQRGDAGVIHRLRGRPSNRKIADTRRHGNARMIPSSPVFVGRRNSFTTMFCSPPIRDFALTRRCVFSSAMSR